MATTTTTTTTTTRPVATETWTATTDRCREQQSAHSSSDQPPDAAPTRLAGSSRPDQGKCTAVKTEARSIAQEYTDRSNGEHIGATQELYLKKCYEFWKRERRRRTVLRASEFAEFLQQPGSECEWRLRICFTLTAGHLIRDNNANNANNMLSRIQVS
jgi:hypothetical protein